MSEHIEDKINVELLIKKLKFYDKAFSIIFTRHQLFALNLHTKDSF